MNTPIISEIALIEDLKKNGEGLDIQVLREVLKVEPTQFSEAMDGADLILKLTEEGLL